MQGQAGPLLTCVTATAAAEAAAAAAETSTGQLASRVFFRPGLLARFTQANDHAGLQAGQVGYG
jgi:hypothetical protein